MEDYPKIYTLTVMEKLEQDELGWPHFGSTRTVGWVPALNDAKECVHYNYADIWETCYDFAVIEEVEAGLYPCCANRWFFKFNTGTKFYEAIEEPEWMKTFVNVGIG